MKIKSITIKNFRSIRDEIHINSFGNALILIGKNNAGKSAILNCIRKGFSGDKITESDFHKGTNDIEMKISFLGITKEWIYDHINEIKEKFTATNKSKFELINSFSDYELLSDPEKIPLDTILNNLLDRCIDEAIEFIFTINQPGGSFVVKFSDGSEAKNRIGIFPNCVVIDDDRKFADEQGMKSGSLTEALIKSISLDKEQQLDPATLEKFARDLTYGEIEKLLESKFQSETQDIQTSISSKFQTFYKPGYEIKLNPYLNTTYKTYSLNPKIYDPVLDTEVDFDKVGAGLRSIYILSLLKTLVEQSNNDNTIFFIEEPELYLHPGLQKEFAQTLKNLSYDNTVVFTTHSSLTLSSFSEESIYEITHTHGKTGVERGQIDSILANLGFSTGDILGKEVVIFVEGESDIKVYQELINKLYPTLSSKILLISCNSCTGLPIFANIKFLNLTTIHANANRIMIRDRDYHVYQDESTLKQETRDAFANNHTVFDDTKLKILSKSAIENYFTDFNIIEQLYTGKSKQAFIDYLKIYVINEPGKDRLLNRQDDAQEIIDGLIEENFDEQIAKLRGHNVMDALMCYLNDKSSLDDIKSFVYHPDRKVFEGNFISSYIDKDTTPFDDIIGHISSIPFISQSLGQND